MTILQEQTEMFEEKNLDQLRAGETSNFTGNMKLPIHRWFRFSAGYSGEWVYRLLKMKKMDNENLTVLDPFLGCGTTTVSADFADVKSYGIEAQPFIYRIANAKSKWNTDIGEFENFAERIKVEAKSLDEPDIEEVPSLLEKCYSDESLRTLFKIRESYFKNRRDDSVSELVWLAITSTLRECSKAGTAPWQYVLPNKSSKNVTDPLDAFDAQIEMMKIDMEKAQNSSSKPNADILNTDARTLEGIEDDTIDLVITSPPYTNNYDYADSTRLEMTFWGEVERWADLHDAARKYLVRSCTQHVTKEKEELDERLNSEKLNPIIDELEPVCRKLEKEKENHGGKKKYDQMVAAYFKDQFDIWNELRRVCKKESEICYVLGDSAPYGVHVPVDEWVSKIALDRGFQETEFKKIRDRNVKWDNRVHEVPLKEGNLWVYST